MTITKHIGRSSSHWTVVVMISLLLLLLQSSVVSAQEVNEETYILCPLGQNVVTLENDPSNGMEWKIRFDTSTTDATNNHENNQKPQSQDNDHDDSNNNSNIPKIQVRPCWCITLDNQYPAFCPSQFDTCRIESGLKVTCMNLLPEHSANWWPFLSPIAIVLTCSLVCFCCGTLRGQSCRDYITLLFYNTILGNCWDQQARQARYHQQLEQIAQRMQQRNPSWVQTLLTSGIERELRERSSRGNDTIDNSSIFPPIQLELQTRIYHRLSIMTSVHDDQTYLIESDYDEENVKMMKLENQPTNQVMELQNAETNDDMLHPSLDNDFTSVTSDEDGELCVICFTNLKEGDRVGNIPCNHLFHVNCLKEWLKKKNECPLCSATSIAVLKQ